MTDRPRRRHPAAASRVAALGLGTATMLGLVGAMTLADRAAAGDQAPAVPPVTAPQIVVVIHQRDGATTTASTSTAATTPVAGTPVAATPVAAPAPTPVVLTAQPVVVAAPAGAAPAASTHGSR